MKSTTTPHHLLLQAIAEPLTRSLSCYLDNVALASGPPSLEGPLAFAFAAGYREAFKDVVMVFTGDQEHDAYEFTWDPEDFVSIVLAIVPPEDSALAASVYAATGYSTSTVPGGSPGQREPKSLTSSKEA